MALLTKMFDKVLRRPRRGPPTAAPIDSDPIPEDAAKAAVRTLAGVLRSYGDQAIEIEDLDRAQTAERFRTWSEHLLHAAARDWDGAYGAFARHRHSERVKVEHAVGELRATIFSVMQRLSRSVQGQRSIDREVSSEMTRLRRAISEAPVEDLRRDVLTAVDALGRALAERRAQQQIELDALGSELQLLRSQLQAAQSQLEVDPLTQLYTRASFDQQLARVASLNSLAGEQASLLLFEIDRFESLVEEYGPPIGNQLLRLLSDAVVRAFPRKTDLVARHTAAGFAVILPYDGIDAARGMGERLLATVRTTVLTSAAAAIRVTLSGGATGLRRGEEPVSWLARTEHALKRAQLQGRDRLVCTAVPSAL
jgi:diguanylate cyclase (GGDEF)-like protein